MRHLLCALSLLALISGCGTGTFRSENDTDKQYGMFVDHESAGARGGVGNYVDRINWGNSSTVATTPAPTPTHVEAAPAAKVDTTTTTTTTTTEKKTTAPAKKKAKKAAKTAN